MFNSFSRRRIVKVAVGFVAGIACIVQTQTIVQAKERIEERSEELLAPPKISLAGTYIIRSLGTTPGDAYLDGRTGNGTVGLAPTYIEGQGFSGASWSIERTDEPCEGPEG